MKDYDLAVAQEDGEMQLSFFPPPQNRERIWKGEEFSWDEARP
jgi:hypothetical protein